VPYEPTVARLQEIVSGYPGITRDLLTYLRERIKEVLTGASASIVVRIYGPDLAQLSSTANRVADAIRPLQGVANLNVQQQIMISQIAITYRPEAGASLGVGPQDIRHVTDVLLTGQRVGQVYESQKIFDVVVRGTPQFSRDVDAIRNLIIDTSQGGAVAIRDVADVGIVPTPNVITREAASRCIDVTLNAGAGRPLSELATEVKSAVAQVSFDQGYYAEVLGEFAELEAARNRLFIASGISVLGIFFILHALFGSARKALLMFLGLPVALVGGVIAAYIGSSTLSLGSFIGFITVLGIAARNGIMLISHYGHLEAEGRHDVRAGFGAARRGRAAGSDSDDRSRCRACAASLGLGRHEARLRDRIPDGGGHLGRPDQLDTGQPLPAAAVVFEVRTVESSAYEPT
jgi:Cu/Ag efflux pump CusA